MEESDNEVVITLKFPNGKWLGLMEWQDKVSLAIKVVEAIMRGERGFVTVVSSDTMGD